MPIDVRDGSHFRELLGSGKLVVADFTASWCGPCMRFAPQFDAMAAKYPEAIWCKVWEHQCRELIMSCGVRSFPTFHFYVSGNKVDEMSGARGQQLEQKVQHWLSVAGPQRLGPVTVKVKFVRERVRESGTGKILVSEEVELEVDPSDGLDVLQFQILSITDIEVDEQLITGGPDDQPVSVLSDADLKKALSLGGGGMYGNYPVLRVKKGRAPPPYVPPPSYGTAQLASAAAWRDCCSAVFFGNEALLQPAWQVREAAGEQKDDAALHLVCHACASRCFGPAAGGKAAAALAPGASSVVPFACETAQACTAGLGVDAFKTRRQGGKELLSHGPVAAKRAMADALEAAGVEAQLQGAGAQGMPSFVSRIDGVLRCVRAYEDPAAQAKAQAVMPVQVLQAARSQGGDEAVCRALLHWFKHDFFQWVNKPACDVCQCSDTESRGTSPPNPHERDAAWASVVEVYRCTRCAATTRFPRVNNPSALLDTRRGRCGEWANCFTLCCRAAGLRARYVLDWTDHVWTEIWLSGQWTHADSCEDKLDSPLMYEHGWGKQLTYTVTVGTEGVLDATPRYTRRWRHVACRRTLVPARGLAQELANINLKIRTALAPHSRAQAEAAEAVETAELQAMCLLTYDTDAERLKSDEAEGRVSGDRAWVASRGEDGGMCAAGNVPLPQGASLLVGRKGYMGHRVTAGLRRLVVQATAHPQAGASLSVGAMTLAAVAKGPAAAAVAAICCSSGTLLFCGAYGTGSGVSSFEQLQSDLAALPKGALIAAAAARGDNTAYLRSALAAAMSSTAVPLSDADNDSSAQPASCRTWVLLGAAMAHVPWARVNCGYSSAPVAAAVELAVPQTAPAAAAAAAAAQSDASALLVDTALALPLLQLPPLDLGSGSSGGTVLSYCPGQPVLIGEVCGSGGAVHAPGWSTTLLPASVGVDGAAACGALPQGGVWRVVEMHDATGSAHDDTIAFSDADAAFPAVGADGGAAAAAVMGGSGGGALLPLPRVVEILGWASDAHVNGVQLHYRIGTVRVTGVRHLGDHGTYRQSAMMLNDREGVASVHVRAGLLVDQVTVTTTKGRSHTWGSATTESPQRSYSVPDGHTFLGFSGGVGGHLHSLGIITVSESGTLAAAAAADADMPRFAAAVPLLYSADPARRAVAALIHLQMSADGNNAAAAAAARAAAETALKYAANVLRDAAKFSRIRAGNAVFAAKIGSVRGGPMLLRALGFELESAQAATSTVAAAQAGAGATAMTSDAFYVFDPRQRSALAARCASMRAALADLNFDP